MKNLCLNEICLAVNYRNYLKQNIKCCSSIIKRFTYNSSFTLEICYIKNCPKLLVYLFISSLDFAEAITAKCA